MPLAERTLRGGNHRSRGQRMEWGHPKPQTATKLIGTAIGTSTETRQCPTCHRDVGVRTDGRIRNHRVGKDRKNSWPCPGDERPAA
jgi:hypothetical protein